MRDATKALRAASSLVETVICAIDRSPMPGTALSDIALTTLPLFTRRDLDQAQRGHAG